MSVTSQAWQPQIENASTPEEIIGVLRQFNLDAIADRLTDLRTLVEDDPEESPMELESLRSLAIFLMSEIRERQLPEPEIGVTPDGLIEIAWSLPPTMVSWPWASCSLGKFSTLPSLHRPNMESSKRPLAERRLRTRL